LERLEGGGLRGKVEVSVSVKKADGEGGVVGGWGHKTEVIPSRLLLLLLLLPGPHAAWICFPRPLHYRDQQLHAPTSFVVSNSDLLFVALRVWEECQSH